MRLFVTNENMNDSCGGGGCLCHEIKNVDTDGPYISFPDNEMENYMSPNALLCAKCARYAVKLLDEHEAEQAVVDGTAEEV